MLPADAVLAMVKVLDLLFLMMSSVLELKTDFWTAQPGLLELITVFIPKMLEYLAPQVSLYRPSSLKKKIYIYIYNIYIYI